MRRLGVSLLAIVVAFGLLEGLYRGYKWLRYGSVNYLDLYAVGYFTPHPDYGYVPTPKFSSSSIPQWIRRGIYGYHYFMTSRYTTNSLGLRGHEVGPKKAGVKRIIAVGGSTTMAMQVHDVETWPAQLERLYRERGKRVEIVNAGVNGWRIREDLLRTKQKLLPLAPDVLLIASGWNDVWKGVQHGDPNAIMHPWNIPGWAHFKILENFRVQYLNRVGYDQSLMRTFQERARLDAPWVPVLTGRLREMVEAARANKTEPVFVHLPGLCRETAPREERELVQSDTALIIRILPEHYQLWAKMNTVLGQIDEQMGRELGVQTIDVHRSFDRFSNDYRLSLFVDEIHMTALGHLEAAKVIAEQLP